MFLIRINTRSFSLPSVHSKFLLVIYTFEAKIGQIAPGKTSNRGRKANKSTLLTATPSSTSSVVVTFLRLFNIKNVSIVLRP